MRTMRFGLAALAAMIVSVGAVGVSGCGGNPNQTEYDAHTPPGKPSDDPYDAKVAYRRARTLNVPKQLQSKIEVPAPTPTQ
jgi:hypothetical protein